MQRDYLPAIASHLSTAHTLGLDKIWTVAIMTSDKRGHNRHDGDVARDDGGGVCGAERRVERGGRRPRKPKERPLCSRFGAVVCVAASSLVAEIFGG